MPEPPSRLRVAVVDGRGRAARAPGLARWLSDVAPRAARGDLTVALVSDAHIRALNRTYRKKDAPTDVLSSPAAAPDAAGARVAKTSMPGFPGQDSYLGDVVIARGVAARQARHAGHPFSAELRILALHGLLHLIGYDHERDHGQMKRLEARLRRKGGLAAGLIERNR